MYVWTAQFHCKMVMPLKCRSLKQGTIPATGRMMNWRQTYFLACSYKSYKSYNMFSLHACTILHTLKCSCRSRCRCHMILPCRTCANCRSAS